MVLPLITRNTQEALRTVPDSYRTGALGMGSTKWHMIRTILLPSSMPGIVTGIILALGRIVGESAALLFTAGSDYKLPKFTGAFGDNLAKLVQGNGVRRYPDDRTVFADAEGTVRQRLRYRLRSDHYRVDPEPADQAGSK